VWIFALTLVAAALVVLVTGGSFARLIHLPIEASWLLFVGLVSQIAIRVIDLPRYLVDNLGYAALMISYVFLLAFCLVNLPRRGMGAVAVGIALNAIVIGLNMGMPTRPVNLNGDEHSATKLMHRSVKHRPASRNDVLGALGDKILLPPPFNELVSVGDLVLALGVCQLGYYASRRTRSPQRPRCYGVRRGAPRSSRTRSSALNT
jgi:hypothetical protein